MKTIRQRQKSQVWSIDYIIAVVLLLLIVLLSFRYLITTREGSLTTSSLTTDAAAVSDLLLSSGYPESWSSSNVTRAGLTGGDYRLNATKVSSFASLPYTKQKMLLSTQHDFLLYFLMANNTLLTVNGVDVTGKGSVISEIPTIDGTSHNLIKTERLLIYDREIVKMVVLLWD